MENSVNKKVSVTQMWYQLSLHNKRYAYGPVPNGTATKTIYGTPFEITIYVQFIV